VKRSLATRLLQPDLRKVLHEAAGQSALRPQLQTKTFKKTSLAMNEGFCQQVTPDQQRSHASVEPNEVR